MQRRLRSLGFEQVGLLLSPGGDDVVVEVWRCAADQILGLVRIGGAGAYVELRTRYDDGGETACAPEAGEETLEIGDLLARHRAAVVAECARGCHPAPVPDDLEGAAAAF